MKTPLGQKTTLLQRLRKLQGFLLMKRDVSRRSRSSTRSKTNTI